MLGIIGGSGLSVLANLEVTGQRALQTPYGEPSAVVRLGRMAGRPVAFLARHGEGHTIPPHEVNYRANLWALRDCGVDDVLAVASVGGIRADLAPGSLAVPDQIIDYTHGRAATIHAGTGGPVTHIDFTHPYCEPFRQRILRAAGVAGEAVTAGGTYAATQGPRLETAAEITRLERDGADMVGMTGMPEAGLARELGLCYAAMAVVVNYAAGRGTSRQGIDAADMERTMPAAMARVRRIIETLVTIDGG